MSYIGREPQIGNFQICDAISTVNNQAAYTMQVSSVDVLPESANHMIVSLNGVIQKPNSSYTVSGATITFASNLVTGDVINFIQILGSVLDLGVPSDDTVTAAKLSSNAVTTAKILDANVTTAKITDNAITLAKLASGTDGNIISYDTSGNPVAVATGNDGQVLTSAGAGAVPTFETLPVGGITEADQWRITANTNAGSNAYVTSNWERIDTAGFGKLGTGLSESSGVFSFASTGIYLITYYAHVLLEGSDVNVEYKIYSTINNSDYTMQTLAVAGSQSNPDGVRGAMSNAFLFDVTNTTNCKFKFYTDSFNTATALIGDSTWTATGFNAIRLGDT